MEKIAFLFPGQGSHYVGMSNGLHKQYSIVRETFEEANEMLGYDLAKLCFEGTLAELSKSKNAHPAILVSSVASFRVYMEEFGIVPQFLAGHSLGEYSALTCAGAIPFADAVRLVHERGMLTDDFAERGVGAMTIIDGLDRDVVELECKKILLKGQRVTISCYNTPTQTAISGDADAVMELEGVLLELGAKITPLISSAPFHSMLMDTVSRKLMEIMEPIQFGFFKYPVITNINAQPMAQPEKVAENLLQHLTKPVQWERTMNCLKNKGVTLAVEMGPKNMLTKMVRENVSGIESLCFGSREDQSKLDQILSQYPGLKKHIPTVITKCLAVAVSTPNQNWDHEDYQQNVIQPYRQIQELQDQLEETGEKPSLEQMKKALDLLKLILETKKVAANEQVRWFNQIIDETGTYYKLKEYTTSFIQKEFIS